MNMPTKKDKKAVIEELRLVRTATDKRMEGARHAVNPMRDY